MLLGDRSPFPDLRWPVYLNHAGVGALAASTVEAITQAARAQAVHGANATGPWLAQADRLRVDAAALLGVPAGGVALLRSTGEGIAAIASCLPWRPGDRIILFDGEFPSNVLPWLRAAREHDLEVVRLPASAFHGTSGDGLGALERALRGGARLVAVSAVQFQTGLRMPVEAITRLVHAAGGEILVDAIQSAGATPVDLTEVDYVACGGHKWLMGPVGTAVLHVRPDRLAALRPRVAGWLSQVDPIRFLSGEPGALQYDKAWQVGPALFEGGAQSFALHAGLGEALRLALEVTPAATFAHVQPLLDVIEEAALARGWRSARSPVPAQRSCILSVRPADGAPTGPLAQALAERGISVATPDGWLRFAPSWPTPAEHAAEAAEALARL